MGLYKEVKLLYLYLQALESVFMPFSLVVNLVDISILAKKQILLSEMSLTKSRQQNLESNGQSKTTTCIKANKESIRDTGNMNISSNTGLTPLQTLI